MKVLHVINSLETGGGEKLVIDTVPKYNEEGIPTDVLLLNGDRTPFFEKLQSLNCCNIYSLGTRSVYNPLHIFKIIPYLKKYDVIQVHLFPSQYWVAVAKLLSFSKCKIIYTEHSTSSRRMRNKIFRLIDPFFYWPYSKIICITDTVSEGVRARIPEIDGKLLVINNGVDIKKFRDAPPFPLHKIFSQEVINRKILIQVSSFQPPKDQATLIRAVKVLPENVVLLLIGDGELRESCNNLVQELGLQERVVFLGIRTDVAQLLKAADIIVLSSGYEGLSLASIEGMASGRPFIASDVPGLTEIVGGAGELFTAGDAHDLASKIQYLLSNGNVYEATVQKCTARAESYDIKTMISRHMDLYRSLV